MPNLFDNATNTQGVIVYGGESSSDYGMVVAEAPAYERPKRKQTIYNVPGRNGSILFQQDAWEDVNRSYKVWLAESNSRNLPLAKRVDRAEAWLNSQKGYVRLEDNFEPDVFRLAYYSGGDGFSNNMTQYGEATINFTCRPERFLKSADSPIAINRGSDWAQVTYNNPTNFVSKPLFNFTIASTSVSFLMAGNGLVIGPGISGNIVIDCDTMQMYSANGGSLSRYISGTFPTLQPGRNTIIIRLLAGSFSDITNATYTPRYFVI